MLKIMSSVTKREINQESEMCQVSVDQTYEELGCQLGIWNDEGGDCGVRVE